MSKLLHRSPGLTVIYNELSNQANRRVMDLGPMRASNFNFFSDIKCNIHFENLDEFLEEFGNLSTPNLIFRLERYLLSQHGKEKFNAILAWDLFNYLPPEGLKSVLELLHPYCAENSLLHLLSYTTRDIPLQPRAYHIQDRYYLELGAADIEARRLPAVDTSRLIKNTPGYVIQETLSNKEGMQNGIVEYVLRYQPGKIDNKKRALANIELQETLRPEQISIKHRSPALAYTGSNRNNILLDLGPENRHNASRFSSSFREVYAENITALLQTRITHNKREDGTEFGSGIFNFALNLRFDLVHCWDTFNFLDARQLNELLVRLRPFLHAKTRLIVYLYTSSNAPPGPRTFKILDTEELAIAESVSKSLSFNPHSAIEFAKCLPGLRVEKTFFLQTGMLPGLSEYIFGFDERYPSW